VYEEEERPKRPKLTNLSTDSDQVQTDALQRTTSFTYEGSELKTTTKPGGRTTSRVYDSIGRLIAATNHLGRTTRFTYDAGGRELTVTDPLGNHTVSQYFPDENLQSLTNANQQATTYTYDAMGRLASKTDALQRTESYSYGVSGQLESSTDRMGRTTTHTYDALERPFQVSYADGASLTYTFDDLGRVSELADSVGGTISRVYDDFGRVLSETTPQGTLSYTYDVVGRLATMTVPGQAVISYAYDDVDQLTSITQGATVVFMTYDAVNRRTSVTLPNGVVTEYGYDDADQISSITYRHGASQLGSLTYTYDLGGRRTSVGGSWAQVGLPQAIASATYDAANQLVAWGDQTHAYDANGSLVSDGLTSYTWDARGRLTSLSGSKTASFAYDATGRRTAKTSSGLTTQYLYDRINVVTELRSTGTVSYLTGNGPDQWLTRTDASGTRSFAVDSLGSTVAVLDSSAAVVGQPTYEAFGATRTFGASDVQNRFTGREQDENGLYYYRARYYDASVGRFISEDAAGGDVSGNVYAYVENDPANAIDPSGLTKVEACCRGLLRRWPLNIFRHCYIRIIPDQGKADTYGVLGNPGGSANQIPRKNDDGGADEDGNFNGSDRNSGGKCKDVPGNDCQIKKLKAGLEYWVDRQTCPSCGKAYDGFKPTDLVNFFDGFNSNTFVYNMILGAGMSPPGFGRAPGYHWADAVWYPQ
jgi:RHS repeat-associated protein